MSSGPARALIAVAISSVIGGCSTDVRLGGTSPDAMPGLDGPGEDASPTAFAPGNYALRFHDPVDVQCDGTRAGQEGAFAAVTRASEGITDGGVTLSMTEPSRATLSGPAIVATFQRTALELVPQGDPAPGEQKIWDTILEGDSRAVPATTIQRSRLFGIDQNTAASAAVEAAIALVYEAEFGDGGCLVGFRATLTP